MTRVLPLPAPASTSSGPSAATTASRCAGVRSSSRRSSGDDISRLYPTGTECARQARSSRPRGRVSLLKSLREMGVTVPIFIMTGYDSLDVAQEALSAGANGYLPKPFDLLHLDRLVADACGVPLAPLVAAACGLPGRQPPPVSGR